jgi:hypothetical protein
MSEMSLTFKLCRELIEFLGEEQVKCFTDTIDYMRLDTTLLMKEMGRERWKMYYQGAVWINEDEGTVGAGDVAVPIEKEDEMVEKLKKFGCPPDYIHRHPEFKTSHIHFSDCPIKGRVREFAELVSG